MATRQVLAGAYLTGRVDTGVTHAVLVDAEGWELGEKTVCGRVALDRLADALAGDLAAPTCPACAKRAARS